ncbi:hypothetical protein Hanom_Chr05g00473221 [Helianthus anomalus]
MKQSFTSVPLYGSLLITSTACVPCRSCIHTLSSRLIVMRHLLIRSVIPDSEYKPILVSISFTKSLFLPFKKHAIYMKT